MTYQNKYVYSIIRFTQIALTARCFKSPHLFTRPDKVIVSANQTGAQGMGRFQANTSSLITLANFKEKRSKK